MRSIVRAAQRSSRLSLRGVGPAAPGDHAQLWPWGLGQHAQEFEQVAVGILKIERRSGHPGEDDWFVGRGADKIERRHSRFPQTQRRHQ